ncbi:MAG: zonular occludens toxin domain-containing protein [Methylococcaceae bacterium]
MITLITGTPGSGKTAIALDMMVRQTRLDNSRKLYVHGIPELKISHEIVVCESASCDYCSTLPLRPLSDDLENKNCFSSSGYLKADMWQDYAEKGAILFFDEVQNIHRTRSSGAAVPPAVAAYEVHRHRGLDFFMITQNPSLIDGNVRALISRHIHLSSTWARRLQFEFPQCKTDLGSTTGEGIKSNYTLPKNVFSLYKSASLHTKLDRKKPFVLYAIPVVVILIASLIYYEVGRFGQKMNSNSAVAPQAVTQETTSPVKSTADGGTGGAQATGGRTDAVVKTSIQQPHKEVLDMPKLFKKWSQLGISDDELKFLPIQMCAVSSARFVKCKFGSNLSFKHFFTNISCTPTHCFAFLTRILPVNTTPREPITAPNLPFIEPLKTASSE